MFKDDRQMMTSAPSTNRIFVDKAPGVNPRDPAYHKFVSTIDKSILDQASDAKNALLNRQHTLIGGDKTKEQFTMRGHLDSMETVLNDMVTELKYHSQQVQITSAEKDTAGALLEMNIVKARNEVLNDEFRNKQEIRRENDVQCRFYDKMTRMMD